MYVEFAWFGVFINYADYCKNVSIMHVTYRWKVLTIAYFTMSIYFTRIVIFSYAGQFLMAVSVSVINSLKSKLA